MNSLYTYLVEACTILGGLNALATAVALVVPKTAKAYTLIAAIATDLKGLYDVLNGLVGKSAQPAAPKDGDK